VTSWIKTEGISQGKNEIERMGVKMGRAYYTTGPNNEPIVKWGKSNENKY